MELSSFKLRFYILVVIVISGCCRGKEDRHYYIPEDRKTTLSNGDILIYKSNSGDVDSFFINEIADETWSTPLDEDCETLEIFEKLRVYLCPTVELTINQCWQLAQGHNGSNDLFWYNGYLYRFNDDAPYTFDSIILSGVKYYSVYERTEPNTRIEEYYTENGISTIKLLYNCSIGVLCYEFENGEIWELESIIKKQNENQ